LEFCRKLVSFLTEQRNIPLHDLLRFKYQLAKITEQKIAAFRKQAMRGLSTFLLAQKPPLKPVLPMASLR